MFVPDNKTTVVLSLLYLVVLLYVHGECDMPFLELIGDGVCDYEGYNTELCDWDGGDCCKDTCQSWSPFFPCGVAGFECLDPVVPPSGVSDSPEFAEMCVTWAYSGVCGTSINFMCSFCAESCAAVCGDDTTSESPSETLECSVESPGWLGDGYCDTAAYNNEACMWDGGDCCFETCISTGTHPCGINGFDCRDNDILDSSTSPLSDAIDPSGMAWGSFDTTRINYEDGPLTAVDHKLLRGLIEEVGGTVAPETDILTSVYLRTVDVFYTSLLNRQTGYLSETEKLALREWINAGGLLIVTLAGSTEAGDAPYHSWLDPFGLAMTTMSIGSDFVTPNPDVDSQHPLLKSVSNLYFSGGAAFTNTNSDATSLFLYDADPAVTLLQGLGTGDGCVLVIGDHNGFIDERVPYADNLQFMENLVTWVSIKRAVTPPPTNIDATPAVQVTPAATTPLADPSPANETPSGDAGQDSATLPVFSPVGATLPFFSPVSATLPVVDTSTTKPHPPTKTPTSKPTEPPSESPTSAPTDAPTEESGTDVSDGLDLVDDSDYAEDCPSWVDTDQCTANPGFMCVFCALSCLGECIENVISSPPILLPSTSPPESPSPLIITQKSSSPATPQEVGSGECIVENHRWLGDGYCDDLGYNNIDCNYDEGDCCEDTCHDGANMCGSNDFNCIDPRSTGPSPESIPPAPPSPAPPSPGRDTFDEVPSPFVPPPPVSDDNEAPSLVVTAFECGSLSIFPGRLGGKRLLETTTSTPRECCQSCYDEIGCRAWTYDGFSNICILRVNVGPVNDFDEWFYGEKSGELHDENMSKEGGINDAVAIGDSELTEDGGRTAERDGLAANQLPMCHQVSLTLSDEFTRRFDEPICKLRGEIRVQDLDDVTVTVLSRGLPDNAVYILPNGQVEPDTSAPLSLSLSNQRGVDGRGEPVGVVGLMIESPPLTECAAQVTVTDHNGAFYTCQYSCQYELTIDCASCVDVGGPCNSNNIRSCVCDWIDMNVEPPEQRYLHCCETGDDRGWDATCAARAVNCGCQRNELVRTQPQMQDICCFGWSQDCSNYCREHFYVECWENSVFCSGAISEQSPECQACCRTNEVAVSTWNCPPQECEVFPGFPCVSGIDSHGQEFIDCAFERSSSDDLFLSNGSACDIRNCCQLSSWNRRTVWLFQPSTGRCGAVDSKNIVFVDSLRAGWVYGFPQDGNPEGLPSDNCPSDPRKFYFGVCGCDEVDIDGDMDGVVDCLEPSQCLHNAGVSEYPCESQCGNCVVARPFGVGCEVPETERCVCLKNNACCEIVWDQNCSNIAKDLCKCIDYCDVVVEGRTGFNDIINGRYENTHELFTGDHPTYVNIDQRNSDDKEIYLYFYDLLSRWYIGLELGTAESLYAKVEQGTEVPQQITQTWQVLSSNFQFDEQVQVSCASPCCWSAGYEYSMPGFGYLQLETTTLFDCKEQCCLDPDCIGIQYSERATDGIQKKCALHSEHEPMLEIYKDYLLYLMTNCAFEDSSI